MPYIKIWIHLVWATKKRMPLLNDDIRHIIFNHIKENAASKNIHLDCVNGHTDHVHCLVSFNSDQTISKVAQLIKGESSYWINKNNLCSSGFEWQDDYFAVSVSPSAVSQVRNYIQNQEAHHRITTFTEEYRQFLTKCGFPQPPNSNKM